MYQFMEDAEETADLISRVYLDAYKKFQNMCFKL